MTSQEQAVKTKEATARKWAARTARWAAWKIAQGKK
jgi:hypothetical protein